MAINRLLRAESKNSPTFMMRTHYNFKQINPQQWYRERSTWNCADWGSIVFSDESRFLLCPDDSRKRVWRRPGQRVNPGFTFAPHTGPQQGVMVWVIRFLNAEGIQTSQICQRMKNIYGESCLSQKKNIYKWVNEFKNGRITCTDIERPGRPSVTTTPSTINEVENLILEDRKISIFTIADNLNISYGTVHTIIKEQLQFRKICCRWIPHFLNLDQKLNIIPDLAPSEYFLFGLLKKELKGKRFDSDEDVQKVVQDFFHTLPKSAYKDGIYKFPERWRRCIKSQGGGDQAEEESLKAADAPKRSGDKSRRPESGRQLLLPCRLCLLSLFSSSSPRSLRPGTGSGSSAGPALQEDIRLVPSTATSSTLTSSAKPLDRSFLIA
ncbi:hypothetical protein LAZ67_4000956 [Cordylochernes scorpioides]|uniref:Mos1 transposase HTH domain-containing protein n=1 Tax=Cordylochernes scorpioides TaxID=51811 RepID=A0ABY6KEN8_9ARAC|nr:hypothetical protein LAZ67_4000956 [Cordylochernes scorpioides]